jgi:hypothetical protein
MPAVDGDVLLALASRERSIGCRDEALGARGLAGIGIELHSRVRAAPANSKCPPPVMRSSAALRGLASSRPYPL